MGRFSWALVVLCALIPQIGPHPAAAQGDDRLVWRTLATEHFRLHYHEPLGLLARHLAAEVEQIHERISSALGLTLRQRVELVLADDDDAANGLAGPLPYNAIRLRAVAPDDMSPLADYDDWPRLLLTHEHTHILHLEHTEGVPRLLQLVFGRNYTPQQFLPGWLVEGLATLEETTQTTAGRGRSTMFEMFLRMDALDQRVLGLDWIAFDGEPWPHGNVRYLYGQALMSFIARNHGERALGRFVEEYSRRLVPYGINRAMKRATGRPVTELYADFRRELTERAQAQSDEVLSRGRVEGERLTCHGELTRTPRFVSNEEVVYGVADERRLPELRRLALGAPCREKRITRTLAVAQSAAVPGRDTLIFSAPAYHRTTYSFLDLFRIDGSGRHKTRLTHGMRAREPDVSPNTKYVAYVVHGAGTSHLAISELNDIAGTQHLLVRSERLGQVFTPRFSPDGTQIAYSAWSEGGYRDLWVVEIATGKRLRITYDRALDRGPAWAPDGKTLYFASDRTGISNLYAFDLESKALSQITNVLGGAFQPDASPDGRTLVYVGYSSRGYDLYRLPLHESANLSATPSYTRPLPPPMSPPLAQVSTPYQPLYTLWPRAWELSRDEDADGARLVATTWGKDAVGFHEYSLSTTVSLETGNVGVGTSYAYRKPRFPVLISASARQQDRNDLIVGGRSRTWQARAWSGSLGTLLSFARGLHAFSAQPAYALSDVEKAAPFNVPLDPYAAPPVLPPLGRDARLNLTLSYATARRQAYDISQSWGQSVSVRGSLRRRELWSRVNDYGMSYRAEQFFRFDFRESVIALAYTGAFHTPVTVGGLPAGLVPIFDYVAGTEPAPIDIARLRGFQARSGDRLEVLQLEFRLLVSRVNRGIETLPLFARRVHVAVFSDVGNAYTGRFIPADVAVGAGAELRLDWAAAYGSEYTLRFGLARGLTRGGELQGYTSIARPF